MTFRLNLDRIAKDALADLPDSTADVPLVDDAAMIQAMRLVHWHVSGWCGSHQGPPVSRR